MLREKVQRHRERKKQESQLQTPKEPARRGRPPKKPASSAVDSAPPKKQENVSNKQKSRNS